MDNIELWAKLYEQRHAVINNRHIWQYLVSSAIGNIHIVEFEFDTKEICRRLFDESELDKASKYFDYTCKKIIDGRI